MILTEIRPARARQHAVCKPNKKTGLAVWEVSYNRFVKGDSPQAIAMSPTSGRPIQVATVVGHLLDAITHGKPVDLARLAPFLPPPSKVEWEKLYEAELSTCMNVAGDPNCSGLDGAKFTMTDFLRPVVGHELVDKPFTERSEADRELFGHWCNQLKWYMALRRVNYQPTFKS